MTPPGIKPLATMEEAWEAYDRLLVERARLWVEANRPLFEGIYLLLVEGNYLPEERAHLLAEGTLIVIATAQALYGKDALIDWEGRTVKSGKEE